MSAEKDNTTKTKKAILEAPVKRLGKGTRLQKKNKVLESGRSFTYQTK